MPRPTSQSTVCPALVRAAGAVRIDDRPLPRLGAGDVRIRIAAAGLCRTDLEVAAGTIAVAEPLVLGHECAGTVEEVGAAVDRLRPGDPVAVLPVEACGGCARCAEGHRIACHAPRMLGLDRDGAFTTHLTVPASMAVPVPDLDPRVAALAEPVAAALGVTNAPLAGRGLIYGRNRFAALIARVLDIEGLRDVVIAAAGDVPGSGFDYAIETEATGRTLDDLTRAVRPGGLVVLRSRRTTPIPFTPAPAIRKELRLHAVGYGRFERAVGLLADGRLDVGDLLGPGYALAEFERAFAAARADESRKHFLLP